MKKQNISKFLYLISVLLIIGFCIRLGADYFKSFYNSSLLFYNYILERFVEFIIPSGICFIAAKITKEKYDKNDRD